MGVERAVTRWYVQRQLLFAEITRLEGALDPILQDVVPEQVEKGGAASEESAEAAQAQLEEARKRLKTQGYCPRPMMG
jgi:hypothetical protein